jgi:hypothetical protein
MAAQKDNGASRDDQPPHAAASDNGGEPTGHEREFDRFESLTRRLLQVPKSELDAKRKAEAKRKAKRKTKTA